MAQIPTTAMVESEKLGVEWLSWVSYGGISILLVIFGGIMSGLTLGLMSLGFMDLELLQTAGTSSQKKQAAVILPVVRKQHQLLVTLLLCNAAAMETLPICLDKIFSSVVAVILSVTFVLAFGEIIPQATCSHYGLAIGANLVWLVRILIIICYPIAYPVGKVLDFVIGHNQSALFRRAQLKAFVSIHGQEAGRGGELTHDETTIINGALDLAEKTAEKAMTPIESTFSLDVNIKLDWQTVGDILARGHSRVPVYSGNPKNIIGLLLVKNLLFVQPETETPLSSISIRRIPRVPADMPLYDILNQFQKGSSHMAAVVRTNGKEKVSHGDEEDQSNGAEKSDFKSDIVDSPIEIEHVDFEKSTTDLQLRSQKKISIPKHNEDFKNTQVGVSERMEDTEIIGIITLEDVFEELLQEEIVDETDEYIDVHKRIRVAVAVAASTIARSPSRRVIS